MTAGIRTKDLLNHDQLRIRLASNVEIVLMTICDETETNLTWNQSDPNLYLGSLVNFV